jgi:lipid II:glycine glycyltransferase (peptidoglycan interpeptide bridge formation enzyme)
VSELRVEVATERARFDDAVAASPLADFMQSWEWGEVKRPSGWTPLRLLVTDGERVRAACSVLSKVPAPGVPPLLYAPRGPVLDYADDEALRALVAGVKRHAGKAFMLKCDPPVARADAAALERAGFAHAPSGAFGGVQPVAVMVLDLDKPEDDVFAGFKNKWRYNVRLAERKGVKVREGARDDLRAFYEVLVETARRDGFLVRGRAYFETLWDELEPRGMLKLFLAEYEGRVIAGIVLLCMGGRATYVYGASSNEHRNVMPNHLVQWTAIRWARANGHRVYDFRGVSPVRDGEPVEPHIAGLNRFKEGFGARYVEYAGPYDLVLRPSWYAVWKYGAPAGMKLLKKLRGGAASEAAE